MYNRLNTEIGCTYNRENTNITIQTDYLPGFNPRMTIKLIGSSPSFDIELHDNRRGKFSWAGRVLSKPEISNQQIFLHLYTFYNLQWSSFLQFCHVSFSPSSCNHFCDELRNPNLSHLQCQKFISLHFSLFTLN